MTTIELYPWKITYDYKATRQAYSSAVIGDADRCGCEHCLNFAAVRDEVYPTEVRTVFERIGIDYKKESEVFYLRRISPGKHLYGGRFNFVGKVDYIDETRRPSEDAAGLLQLVEVTEGFSWAFSDDRIGPYSKTSGYKSRAHIDFNATVPWLLETKEPE